MVMLFSASSVQLGLMHTLNIVYGYIIHNDILASMDAGKVTVLILLDLSVAFETIDHAILLKRPDDCFGVTGKALASLNRI